MPVMIVQAVVLLALLVAIVLMLFYFPYPSPWLRPWLPPRKRWPETQIRGWLASGRFHPAFLRYFYRDPKREAPPGDSLLAPADGLVTSAEIQDGVRYVVIALSFWDMHVQRSPLGGKVRKVEAAGDGFMDGEGREFAFLRAKRCPVQKRVVIESESGTFAVRLITSIAARRIETWVGEGEDVTRGQRIGRILLGSTVVFELPPEIPLAVRVGDRVRAGETPIAQPAMLP